jgi:threonine dehydratase
VAEARHAAVTVTDIEQARERIAGRIRVTPTLEKVALGEELGVPTYLKAEHLQRTGSFKLRGALNLMSQLPPEAAARGVVAASAGNHAQGVAVAASEHGLPARIFMPEDASLSKVEATRHYGARVELVGEHLTDAMEAARSYAQDSGAIFVHPFDDPRIVAGQGTVGLEVLEQVPDVSTVVIPIGGGGLFSGMAVALKARRPGVRLVGVQAAACPSLAASLEAGHPVTVESLPTMADGIAVKQPGGITFDIVRDLMDELVTVDEDELSRSMVYLMERAKQVVEGSGAASLAAVQSGKVELDGPLVCVLTGGNIDLNLLMPVIRRGLASSGRYLTFWTTIPDRPGELSRLLALVGELKANILSIEHHREGLHLAVADTRVDLTLQMRNQAHVDEVLRRLSAAGYDVHRDVDR